MALIALKAFCDLILAGANSYVLHVGQHPVIALSGNDGAQYLLACLSGHVRDDVGELNNHLGERFLHMLYVAPLTAQQAFALA